MLHAHAAIWKERGHLTTQGSPIKYGDQILRLLEAVHLPPDVSVSRCKGYQKGSTEVAWVNLAAHQAAKRAALQNHDLIGAATLGPQTNLPESPLYTKGKTLKAKSEGFQGDRMGWFQKEGLLFLPGKLQWKLVNSLHVTAHLGEKVLQILLERSFRGAGLQTTIRQVVFSSPTCQLSNPQGAQRPQLFQSIQWWTYPGEDWQKDFTQMSLKSEGFHTGTEKAEEVVKTNKQTNKQKTAPWNHSEIWSTQVITKWQWDIIYF